MTKQADIYTNEDGTLLVKNATEGVYIEDGSGYKIRVVQTAAGLTLTVFDVSMVPTNFDIEDGELKNKLEIVTTVNGVSNTGLSDALKAKNHYPDEGEVVELSGSLYKVVSAHSDLTNGQYEVDFNDLGDLAIEGTISGLADTPLTDELKKLGRYDWNAGERITYNDGTTKTVEVTYTTSNTETKKYIVETSEIA